jgi:hypothetical protein
LALVWRIANHAADRRLQIVTPNRHTQTNSKSQPSQTVNLIEAGYNKFETATLATFNKKLRAFRDGIPNATAPEVDELEACTIGYTSLEMRSEYTEDDIEVLQGQMDTLLNDDDD